jgi:UDP-GlcNAc:undecaprenyl-phosphate GlcNAc-1-phosphate transferase
LIDTPLSPFWIAACIAFVVAFLAIVSVRSIASHLSLVDKPGGRKIHDHEVPVVGGLGVFLGLFVAVNLLPLSARPDAQFVTICAIFVIVGLVDDRVGLSPWFRLLAQFGCAVWLALDADISARYLGDFIGDEPLVLLDLPAALLTGILVAGGMNAVNMVDGIDGLAGSLSLIAISSLAYVSMHSGLALPFGVSLAAIGAICAFLAFNLPLGINRSIRCFMGDAGSLLIGFILAWLMLQISQAPSASVEPATLLFFVAVPIYDLLWVFGRRLLRGESPLKADNAHLHHTLIKAGTSHVGALVILLSLALILAAIGFWITSAAISSTYVLLAFVTAGALCYLFIRSAALWVPKTIARRATP